MTYKTDKQIVEELSTSPAYQSLNEMLRTDILFFISTLRTQDRKDLCEMIEDKRLSFGKEYGEEGYSDSYNSAIDDVQELINKLDK